MSYPNQQARRALWIALALSVGLLLPTAQAQKFTRTDLVDQNKDPHLINAWGISRSSGSPWWVSDNGTGLTTLYDGAGNVQNLVVTIPGPGNHGTSAPTGQVFNYTGSFQIQGKSPFFIFATEDGTISGWNPQVNPTNAVIVVNRSQHGGEYKGLALLSTPLGPRLYATNFASGHVEMYDGNFKPIGPRSAKQFHIPGLDDNWAPFGIQSIGGDLVVTFAHRTPGHHDEDHGPGLGWVGVFDFQGNLLLTLEHPTLSMLPGESRCHPATLACSATAC